VAKRNVQRERERRRALAYQERIRAKQAKAKRNQIIGAIVAVAVAGAAIAGLVVWSNQPAQTPDTGTADEPVNTPTEEIYPEPTDPVTPGENDSQYDSAPDPAMAENRTWEGLIDTNLGAIAIELDGAAAPQAVANFVFLSKVGYFDNTQCHRLTTKGIFVLQCGSKTGDGTDDPGYSFGPLENVPPDGVYRRGVIAMARAQAEDSMGSQFFIVYQDSELPPPGYTVFGSVTVGMEIIDQVADKGVAPPGDQNGDGAPAEAITIQGIGVQ